MNTAVDRTAVLLVNWNNGHECVQCIDSLLGMATDNFDIVVVDNDSSDGSVAHILTWCHHPVPPPGGSQRPGVAFDSQAGRHGVPAQVLEPTATLPPPAARGVRVFIVPAGSNRGFAAGNNLGLRVAGLQAYSHFWLLNTDTVVQRQALPALLRRAAADPRIGMVGSTLLYFDAPDRVQALGGAWLDPRRMLTAHIGVDEPASLIPERPAEVEAQMAYVVGASMLVSAAFVRDVGPMQEDYFLYFEELDWAQRAQGRGLLVGERLRRPHHDEGKLRYLTLEGKELAAYRLPEAPLRLLLFASRDRLVVTSFLCEAAEFAIELP